MAAIEPTQSKIRQFIFEKFPLARKRQLREEDSLLETGIVDSIGILEIVTFVEQQFAVEVGDDDLQPENFGTIASIAAFVERRKLESAAAPQETEGKVYEPR